MKKIMRLWHRLPVRKLSALCALWVLASMLSPALAAPVPKKAPLRIYKPHAGDCYVQLKPNWPYIKGGDAPVCRAVLANLNKFCSAPPQYNRRKLAPTTKDLQEPDWKPLDPKQNLDLVKATFLAVGNSVEAREESWRGVQARITALAQADVLRLWTADIDIDSDGTLETVYMLENVYPNSPPETNQPTFIVAELGQRTQADFNRHIGEEAYGDLWLAKDEFGEKRWHSIVFDPSTQLRFLVEELVHFKPEPMGAVTRCTIQHITDYERN